MLSSDRETCFSPEDAQCPILTSVKPLWLGGKERPKCGSGVTGWGKNGYPGRCCTKDALDFLAHGSVNPWWTLDCMYGPSREEHRPHQKLRRGTLHCLEVMPRIAIDSAVQDYLYLRSSVDVPCTLEHEVWSLMHRDSFCLSLPWWV